MALDITLTRLGPLGLKASQITAVVKRVNLVYPQGWIVSFLPVHFTNRATRRYGYTPRQGEPGSGRRFAGSYTHRKLLKYHHTRPLENTGTGKAQAMANRRATSTRDSARAIVPARVFNFRNPNSRVDMRRELTTVLDSEQQNLEGLAQKKTDAEVRRASRAS
jgi:hypothetical protein